MIVAGRLLAPGELSPPPPLPPLAVESRAGEYPVRGAEAARQRLGGSRPAAACEALAAAVEATAQAEWATRVARQWEYDRVTAHGLRQEAWTGAP